MEELDLFFPRRKPKEMEFQITTSHSPFQNVILNLRILNRRLLF
jgi:hypothetical protein